MERHQGNIDLRKVHRTLRDNMSSASRDIKSYQITQNILALLESDFKGANIFLCFYPFGSEVNLIRLYERLLDMGKSLYFPISNIEEHELTFKRITDLLTDFDKGHYGIMEPRDSFDTFNYIGEQVVSITPGLVFDRQFNRVGYGAGFYDRFLSKYPDIITIAPCFDNQLIDELNACPHDVPMNYIVTEDKILKGDRL
ncbi:MAG: 5-formyltetrahydrofolate cyclo-ligase [Pseudobutyrivibrio sp.]|nr:5-formyltetrahydrofolate cyclo-ligase [Pseudobutyrivibrio sp.]